VIVENNSLPKDWTLTTIEEIADVNPRLDKTGIDDSLIVSFVPMPAVGAGNGSIDVNQKKSFSKVITHPIKGQCH